MVEGDKGGEGIKTRMSVKEKSLMEGRRSTLVATEVKRILSEKEKEEGIVMVLVDH